MERTIGRAVQQELGRAQAEQMERAMKAAASQPVPEHPPPADAAPATQPPDAATPQPPAAAPGPPAEKPFMVKMPCREESVHISQLPDADLAKALEEMLRKLEETRGEFGQAMMRVHQMTEQVAGFMQIVGVLTFERDRRAGGGVVLMGAGVPGAPKP